MGILKRINNIFKAKTNKALDQIENPIETLEQKIRELSEAQTKSISGLAKVKAVEIKFKNAAKTAMDSSQEYKEKAIRLKARYDKCEEGPEKEQYKADITLMLNQSENFRNDSVTQNANAAKQAALVSNLEGKIKEMKNLIKTTNNEITNLKANSEAAKANKAISKEFSDANFDGLTAQIDSIKSNIAADNAEADAWSELDTNLTSDEDRINKLLNSSSPTADNELFTNFMKDE